MLSREKRLKLSDMLKKAAPEVNGRVYFQKPSNHVMTYPCIRYGFNNISDAFADNRRYREQDEYSITVIDPNPESRIPDKILNLPYCRLDRTYISDGLNHWVFTIYI